MLIFYERILKFSKLRSMHILGDIYRDEEYDMSGIFAEYIILFPVQIVKHNSTFPKDAVHYLSLC